jgi:site-specific DNA recombinase
VLSDSQIRVTLNARGRASPVATVKIPWTSNKTNYDCVPAHSEHKPDPKLVQAIVRAHAWLADLKNGRFSSVEELAATAKLHAKVVRQALRFAFLAPGLIRAILEGRHAAGVTLLRIPKTLPLTWSAHEQMLG